MAVVRGVEIRTMPVAILPPRRQRVWGRIIRDIREERGISQRALAQLAGINRSSLRRIEHGVTGGQIDLIERMLSVLGYELEAHLVAPGAFLEPAGDDPITPAPA